MADQPVKARLVELDATFNIRSGGRTTPIQFNPDTLRVTYANQLGQQQGGGGKAAAPAAGGGGGAAAPAAGDQGGGATRQYVGSSTTKLALQLWFDVTGENGGKADVTKMTEGVRYFMKPQKLGDHGELLPPNVRLEWGAFFFDGTLDSLEETFEFFSADGRPLRAQLSLSMSSQAIQLEFTKGGSDAQRGGPGTKPLTPVTAGASLQAMASVSIGGGTDLGGTGWQAIATANGIEDPLRLAPGKLVDLNLRATAPGF